MKKFLTKFILVVLLYLGLVFLIKQALPFYHGNDELVQKFEIFEQHQEHVNTVFFGPSNINRHIEPRTFDKQTRNKTQSFNLATDACPFPETSFLVENFMRKYDVENIIMHVGSSAEIKEANLHTLRTVYYHDFKRFRFSLSHRKENFSEIKKHVVSFIENVALMFRLKNVLSVSNESLGYDFRNKGYIPMDEKYLANKDRQNPTFVKQEAKFQKIAKRFMSFRPTENFKTYQTDIAIIEECKRLHQVAEKQGVNLYFLFLPSDVLYYKAEDLQNKLYLGDGRDFPEYFDFNLRYNQGHLNSIGADIFSEKLGKTFNKQLKRK